MTEILDTEDARALLGNQSREALAREIHDRHNALEKRAGETRDAITATCSEAMELAKLVEAAHSSMGGKQFALWWREQKLPVGFAEKYLTLARTSDRHTLGDKDQLRLIGVLPEAEHGAAEQQQRQQANPLAWVSYAGKLNASITIESVRAMPAAERHIVLQKLLPLKAIIAELESAA